MDKIESDYRAAKTAYDEAERALAVARHALRLAEDARNSGWKELVAAAARITDDSLGRKLAAEQWGPPVPSTDDRSAT